jgi:DnaJ-class molecular chaperone
MIMNDPYKILGLNANSKLEDVKIKYKSLAKQYHPDKPGGDSDKFKEINTAYDEIINPKHEQQMHSDFFSMFANRSFSGGFGVHVKQQHVQDIPITLEEMYNGKHASFRINNEKVEIHIVPGSKEMDEFRVDVKNILVIFRLRQVKHPLFTREGNNLCTSIDVHLFRLLTSFEVRYTHITKEQYTIRMETKVLHPAHRVVIDGMGLPVRNTTEFGNLIIKLNVIMPESILESDYEKLQEILGYKHVIQQTNMNTVLIAKPLKE